MRTEQQPTDEHENADGVFEPKVYVTDAQKRTATESSLMNLKQTRTLIRQYDERNRRDAKKELASSVEQLEAAFARLDGELVRSNQALVAMSKAFTELHRAIAELESKTLKGRWRRFAAWFFSFEPDTYPSVDDETLAATTIVGDGTGHALPRYNPSIKGKPSVDAIVDGADAHNATMEYAARNDAARKEIIAQGHTL